MSEHNTNALELDADQMREIGYRVVDMLVERISTLRAQPARVPATRHQLDALLVESAPEHAARFEDVLNRLQSDVLAYGARVDHPRFMAFVPGSPTWPGVLGDMIAAAHQSFAGTWLGGAGVAALELVVLDWFREWLGMPPGTSGLLLSGGSAANLTAIAAARATMLGEDFQNATIYFSSETHSSVERACRILGFSNDKVRILPADDDARLPVAALRRAVADDAAAGLRPFFIIANAGTTTAGAIDPLPEIAQFARERGMWFHVDAAYGGFAAITQRGKNWLAGIEHSDSVTLDPHKWLHQPFEVGCLLMRDPQILTNAFHIMPDYLQDTLTTGAEVNFADRGIQLTRSARAIKIWLSIQYFGLSAFRTAIDATLDHAIAAQQHIKNSPSLELLSPARLGIVCFRRIVDKPIDESALDTLNARILADLTTSGFAMISSTKIDSHFALRFCILNHRTTRADVLQVLKWIEDFNVEVS
ncbi:MAG TPA: aminotransferase class I/II-fold pyridoxal phosphate-dependent enzyme [Longimicrobiales bacterium]|nr:aminotransferase class I/II-fold pyridoxal phosphate-dependent enzyme [Longimicrobiales bacterium]